jgi:hypothetical protein
MVTKKILVLHWAWRRICFTTDVCHWSRTWERFRNINMVADMAQSESLLVYALDNCVFVVCFATAVLGVSSQKRPGHLWSPLTLGAVSQEVGRLIRGANYSPVFSTEVKNYGRYTSTWSYVFITSIHKTVYFTFYSHARIQIFFLQILRPNFVGSSASGTCTTKWSHKYLRQRILIYFLLQ